MQDFEVFCRRSHMTTFRVLATVTGSREDAADLCQEAYGKAARDWTKVGAMDSSAAWVRRVGLNGATDLGRRRTRQGRALRRLAAERQPEHLDDVSVEVLDALSRLPLAERKVVVLHHLLSLSTTEIAAELGRASGTVKG